MNDRYINKKKYKPINPNKIQKLLIRSTNWIGDAIMTTPAVRAIRENFPNAQISILSKPWVSSIFNNSKYVDKVIVYDSNNRHKGIKGIYRLIKELKAQKFDAAILLQNAIEAAIIAYFAQIPVRIGFNTDARTLLLTHPIPCTKKIKEMHQVFYYLKILEGIGLKTSGDELYLKINDSDNEYADEFVNKNVSPQQKIVGINPAATYGSAKQWFPERFARLADLICETYDYKIVIFGGPDDVELGKTISKMMYNQVLDLSGKTTLGQALAIISKLNLFITNDSGLMHVAAALKIPLIAIFGSTNPITTSPWSSNSKIVRIPIDCSPCLKKECPKAHKLCMENINVDMVFELVKEML